MNTSKRHHQLRSIEDKNISTSTSAFIETPLTSISQTIENRLNNLNHQQIDWQEQINGFHHKKSRFIQEYFDNSIRAKNKQTDVNRTKTILNQTQNDNEDDWVCPVAVVLRRAGYDVPLRPSKSWLERDRKKQALLRKQQTSSKEI